MEKKLKITMPEDGRLTLEKARIASELMFPHKPDESEFLSLITESLRFAFMEGVRFAGIK